MKTLIFGDTHINDKNLLELKDIFKEILKYPADRLIHLGDYYDCVGNSKRPTAKEILFGTKWATKLKEKYKNVIFLQGNHDKTRDISVIDYLQYLGIQIVDKYIDDKNNLFGHFMLHQSQLSYGTGKCGIKDLTKYNKVFLGHQHSFQQLSDSIYHLGCFDSQTEILTNKGWKYFKDLDKTEKVATLNPNKQTLEFQTPTDYICANYQGRMYNVKNNHIDLLVTPNHRIYCKRRGAKNYQLLKAEEIYKVNEKYIPRTCNWQGRSIKYFILPQYKKIYKSGRNYHLIKRYYKAKVKIPINLWIKFLAWYLSEGCYSNNTIIISQSIKSKYFQEIILIVKKLSKLLNCNFSILNNNNNVKNITIYDSRLAQYLKQYGNSHQKYIPNYIKKLTTSKINLFLDTYIKGNGCIQPTSKSITSYSDRVLGDLQELILKTGNWGKIKNHVIYFQKCKNSTLYPKQEKMLNYNGKVYCVTVPNHIIYIRRNGIPCWSGNSVCYHNWNEVEDKAKYIGILEENKLKLIKLNSPISMIDINSVKELDTIEPDTKVRLIITNFNQFKKEVNNIEKYKDKFYAFKLKLDFKQEINPKIKQENKNLKEIINKWLEHIEDKEVKEILKKEIKNAIL